MVFLEPAALPPDGANSSPHTSSQPLGSIASRSSRLAVGRRGRRCLRRGPDEFRIGQFPSLDSLGLDVKAPRPDVGSSASSDAET